METLLAGGHLEQIQTIRCTAAGASISASGNLTNVLWQTVDTNLTGNAWDTVAELRPDHTLTMYSYPNGDHSTITELSGAPSASWSWNQLAGGTWGNWPPIVDGTATTNIAGTWGEPLSAQAYDIASSITLSYDSFSYAASDALRRSYTVTHLDGTSETCFYACCGLSSSTDRDGVTTVYSYDSIPRQTASTRLGITTTNILDSAGNVLDCIRIGTDLSSMLLSSAVYNNDGSLLWETNAIHGGTSHTQGTNIAGETVITDTDPQLGTRITTYYQDGSVRSVAGTAGAPVQYLYGVDAAGSYRTEVRLTAAGGTNEWTKTSNDLAGRAYRTTFAGAGSPCALSYYNTIGQITNRVDADGVSSLHAYNAKGEEAFIVADLNQNQQIDWGGPDRITYVTNDVTVDNGTNVHRSRTYVWLGTGGAPTLLSTTESSTDGLQTWSTLWNNVSPVTSHAVTVYAAGGWRYVTNAAPDGSLTLSAYQYGRLVSVTQYDGSQPPNQTGQTTYGYDSHGRQNTSWDARNGTTTFYFNNADQVVATLTPVPGTGQSAQLTTNICDNLGRIAATVLPDNTVVSNLYYPNSQILLTYGSRTYPVGYTYDAQGRKQTMTTWTNFSSGQGAAVTTWNYDQYRGWLTNKTYDGSTPGPTYQYTAAGRLSARFWARGVITTYLYDTAGGLTNVAYSNDPQNTPAVAYAYDRLGRRQTVVRNGITTTFAYNSANQPLSESYSGGVLGGLSLTNGYDQYFRRTTLAALNGAAAILRQSFTYDNASRLLTASDGGGNGATYSYLANSPLLYQTTFTNNGVTRMTTTKQYDYLNRLTSIASSPSASAQVSFSYQYNNANQRIAVTNGDNSYWAYGYDSLGQVTSGKKYWGDNSVVAGEQFQYAFDTIGNRLSTDAGGDQNGNNLRYATYSANNLNQYAARTVPGYAELTGSAAPSAKVAIFGGSGAWVSAYRKTNYFWGELSLNNSGGPLWATITNVAVVTNGSSPANASSTSGSVFIPRTPEAFTYDADGNLLTDGRWSYTWDAENRLIGMTNYASGAPAQVLAFSYDWQDRRIDKQTSLINVITNHLAFVYDDCNLIASLNATNGSIIESYLWGLDICGTPQTAAGIGGLLEISDSANGCHFASFDGNGNLSALIAATSAANSATYEYGPFGELQRGSGAMTRCNPFRWSTKYRDDETDLIYYGCRYYSGSTGRWLARDPIEEEGGRNLYVSCGNDAVNGFDPFGLTWRIERAGRNRARAKPQSGDTVTALAKVIKFDDFDYRKWLKPVGPTRMPVSATVGITDCSEFTIPNTVYIELGQMSGFLDNISPIPSWQLSLRLLGGNYIRLGYNVVLRWPSDPDTARADLQDKNIFGFAYGGHGGGNTAAGTASMELVFSAAANDSMLDGARYTPYGINFLYAYACSSANQMPKSPALQRKLHYKYSSWEMNVSTRGQFRGMWGEVNGYQTWSHEIRTPGTNSQ